MARTTQINLRLDPRTIARAAALVKAWEKRAAEDPMLAAMRLTPSAVLKIALSRGLDALEADEERRAGKRR